MRGLIGQLLGPGRALLGIADCARWVRDCFTDDRVAVADKALLLDWYRLWTRCAEVASRARRGRTAKARFLRRLRRRLWRGDVPGAVRVIGEEVPRARPGSALETFGAYLRAGQAYIPDYRARWGACRYIASGQAEKANDRRQEGRGMHWSGEMGDALAALCTLKRNREWKRYWQQAAAQPTLLAAAT